MKASEVFDLPLTADGCLVYQSLGNEYAAEFDSSKKAYIAAHAINHADELADALADLIEQSANYAANFKSEYYSAIDAIEDYRGAK